MNTINFFLQANIYLILFYCFYIILLRTETFFSLNRMYLLSAALLSCAIPILHSTWVNSLFNTTKIAQSKESFNLIISEVGGFYEAQSNPLSPSNILFLVYATGFIAVSARFTIRLLKLFFGKYNDKIPAFSFFNKIVVSKELNAYDTIYAHEQVHSKQLHSADVIFFELLTIIFWFNPVIYLYRKDIKNIHEFIADELASHADKAGYAMLLLCNTLNIKPDQLTNSFYNQSMLKKRITMLQKTKSRKAALLKYGLSAPLFAAMLIFSSATISKKAERAIEKTNLNVPSDDLSEITSAMFDKTITHIKRNDQVYLTDTLPDKSIHNFGTVDVLPEYPGGMQKFYEFIGKTYKYPQEAIKNHVKGRVTISFVVEEDGELTDLKVLHDMGYGTGDAAIEMLKKSPKWKPGIQNGQAVRVAYAIPIMLNVEAKAGGNIQKDSEPLYIVDGIERTSDEIKSINPQTIKSLNVLKNADEVARYGEKGKNGVVQIYINQEPPKDANAVRVKNIKVENALSTDSTKTVYSENGAILKLGKAEQFNGLVIVDGERKDPSFNFKNLDPEKIESMLILNVENATAKYGDKGKNGVIEIKMKK
ncbi:TonB family protein [Pedobacter sp. HMF7647]|uniref:TonB family protein n=1 Tax=Hufsiella arboris TaxID=2695275 RepID=A0A7K1YBZ8_9SPHI|nr:M56 family metallopeptidase [Hufsiella arboris]MXV51609.1 TonB family protein [Hufsiella arboris]